MKNIIDIVYDKKEKEIRDRLSKARKQPSLKIITVGDDYASEVYVKNKLKECEIFGVDCWHVRLPADTTQQTLNLYVASSPGGVMVQLPLPRHLSVPEIPLNKDVDGLSALSLGLVMEGSDDPFLPCTVQACIDIMEEYNQDIFYTGAKVAVLGRSTIVGKPLVMELINRQCTVTSFNSQSNLNHVDWLDFDVVITATGDHGVLRSSMFCEGQLVIDVGITRDCGRLVGDVWHDAETDATITPVPKGVGRLTVLNVIGNLSKLYGG